MTTAMTVSRRKKKKRTFSCPKGKNVAVFSFLGCQNDATSAHQIQLQFWYHAERDKKANAAISSKEAQCPIFCMGGKQIMVMSYRAGNYLNIIITSNAELVSNSAPVYSKSLKSHFIVTRRAYCLF